MIGGSDYGDWLPEYEDDIGGSYDDNYDLERMIKRLEKSLELDEPEERAVEAPVEPQEREDEQAGYPTTKEDPIDRYSFLYWQ